jgi:outer membrane protein assembly factor BamA
MRVWALLLLATLLVVPASYAQAPAEGADKLDSVQVTGSTRFRSDQIATAIGLHPGMMVTRDDLQKGANDLAQLGVFSHVQYRYATVETGVRAEYEVTDLPGIPVAFDNFPWFSDAELIAAIQKSGILFDGAAPRGGTVLDAMSSALEKMIASRGVFTGVSHMLVTAALGGAPIQQFSVERSDIRIGSIEFSDALAENDHGIHARLTDLVGQPYSRMMIELFNVEQVRPVYLAHSFLEVRFGAPVCKFPEGAVGAAAKNVNVVVNVEPGPAFAWNGVLWLGNTAVSLLELEQAIPLHQGDPADGTKIEAGWESVRAAYRERGYLDADVKAVPRFNDATKQAAYTATITEGPQYHMGKLVLTGLSVESERRMRATWRIPAGAAFDNNIYEDFLKTGISQALEGLPVHYEKIGHFLQNNPDGTVDVLLDFQ